MTEAWFSALGEPLDEDERNELAAYLAGLSMDPAMPVRRVSTWQEASELCRAPSDEWWRAEEAERARLERSARLDPTDADWLALNEASYAAYQARLARAAQAPVAHAFLRKYALYCSGHWPLGVYDQRFAIF